MIKKICIISLENNSTVNGLRAHLHDVEQYHIQNVFSEIVKEGESVGETVNQCFLELRAKECDLIVLTGAITGSGCFELFMPRLSPKEMSAALGFELSRYFPCATANIISNYRIIEQNDSDSSKRTRLRVFFVPKLEWEKWLGDINQNKIKFDTFIYPFMAAGKKFADLPLKLSGIDSEFYLSRLGEDGIRQMHLDDEQMNSSELLAVLQKKFRFPGDAPTESLCSCLLIADYVLSGEYKKEESMSKFPVPARFIPQRLRVMKIMLALSGLLALSGFVLMLWMNWSTAYDRYDVIRNQVAAITVELEKNRNIEIRNTTRNKDVHKFLTMIPPRLEIVKILGFLAQHLPKNIWISDFVLVNSKLFITMKSPSDPDTALSQLNNSPYFVVSNLRKNRNLDGSYFIYLTLTASE